MRIVLLTLFLAAPVVADESVQKDPAPPPALVWAYLAPANVPKLASPPKHYTPPNGFAGHAWGDLRSTFDKLPAEPAAVRGAWTRGFLMPLELVCTGKSVERCTVEDFARAEKSRMRDGDGFHLLSEYLIESQGFKFPGTGVVLHPIVYQFCANWHGEQARRKEESLKAEQAKDGSAKVSLPPAAPASGAASPSNAGP